MRGFFFFSFSFTFLNPRLADWGMLHHIWERQDVLSRERRWEPGSQHEDRSLWRTGGWSNGGSVSALQRQGETKQTGLV